MQNRVKNFFSIELRPLINLHRLFIFATLYFILAQGIILLLSNGLQWIYNILGIWQILEPFYLAVYDPLLDSNVNQYSLLYDFIYTPFISLSLFLSVLITIVAVTWVIVEIIQLIIEEARIRGMLGIRIDEVK